MKETHIREHLNKGWIRAIITFEIVGKPAKHVEQSLEEYIENLKTDERVIIMRDEREPAEEVDEGLYSAFAEEEMLVKNLETFTWLCINFSPASIEILQPDDLDIKARDLTNWFNDLLSKLHEIGTNYRSHKAANEHLTVALNQLVKNVILLSLRGGKPKDVKDLVADTGVYEEQLEPFLKHMLEHGHLILQDKKYALPPAMPKPAVSAPQAQPSAPPPAPTSAPPAQATAKKAPKAKKGKQ